jgi:hypothetical protein
VIAAVLAFLSIIFLIPIFREYWATGLVPRFPTLIVCCFVMMSAVLSVFAGTILSTLALNDRREFEMQLNMLQRHKETDLAKK